MQKENIAPASKKRYLYLFDSVFSQTKFSTHYVVQLIFATIITTLGLLTGNTVVVIGAMLISPLFWPVMGVALGIITTRKNILKNATSSFFISFIVVIFFSTLVTLIVPIDELSTEITARINPTIIDLFIALAASIIGVFALYYPTISATTAGVAISIALLPPLCVVGIGIGKWSGAIVGNSLLLFGTNSGAIVFMGVIVLYLLKIRPRKAEEETRFKYGVVISGLLMFFLSIPLSLYLKESINQNVISGEINEIITNEIKGISSGARVEKLHIDFLSISQKKPLLVEATIYLPEGVYMTQTERESLLEKIGSISGKNVNLRFNIVSTLSLQSEEDKQRSLLRKDIREVISQELVNYGEEIVVDDVVISFPIIKTDSEKTNVDIVIQVKQYGSTALDYEDMLYLKDIIELRLDVLANIEIEFIPIRRLRESGLEPGTFEKIDQGLKEILLSISDDIYIDELSIKDNRTFIKLYAPSNAAISQEIFWEMEDFVKDSLGNEVNLSLQIIRFEVR